MQNPFKPTAGATPPELVGRAGLLDEFEYGLQQGSGAPGLLTIITGSRGIGKTVMLSEAEGIARCRTSQKETASSSTRWPSRKAHLLLVKSAPSSRPSPTSFPSIGTGSSLRA